MTIYPTLAEKIRSFDDINAAELFSRQHDCLSTRGEIIHHDVNGMFAKPGTWYVIQVATPDALRMAS